MSHTDDAPGTMLDRVSSMLATFIGQQSLTLAEVARRADLPRSSTHRILQRLVELGWVDRRGFEYVLGVRMFEFGTQAARQRHVHTALPVMTDLHRRTGLTVSLSVLDGCGVVVLERVGLFPVNRRDWSVGARQRVEFSAAGHALLAALPTAEWPDLRFDDRPTCYSVRNRTQLERDLDRVRDRCGVALDAQGSVLGVTAAAATVTIGRDRLALTLCGPTRTVNTESMTAAVRRSALRIWHSSAGVPGPGHVADHPVTTAPATTEYVKTAN